MNSSSSIILYTNPTAIERWKQFKEYIDKNKPTDAVYLMDLLWQRFTLTQRKEVWNYMQEEEREEWYAARKASFLRKELLIDIADSREEEKKRRYVLAYRKEGFLENSYPTTIEKIKKEYPVVKSENKKKGFTPIARWQYAKKFLRERKFNRRETIECLYFEWQKFSTEGRKKVWQNMKEVEREFWYSAKDNSFKKEILIETADNLEEARERQIILARRDERIFEGTYLEMINKIKSVKKHYSYL